MKISIKKPNPKILCFAALVPLLTAASAMAQQNDVQRVTDFLGVRTPISHPSVDFPSLDLHRVAILEFEPDQSELIELGELTSSKQHVDLFFDGTGQPLDCAGIDEQLSTEQVGIMCRSLLSRAQVKIPSYYDLAGQRGRLAIWFSSQIGPSHELITPVEFAAGDDAIRYDIRFYEAEGDEEPDCFASPDDVSLAYEADDRVCAVVLDSPDILTTHCSLDPNDRSSLGKGYICGVAGRPVEQRLKRHYSASAGSDALKRRPNYLAQLDSEFPILAAHEGNIRPEIAQRIQYPRIALRREIEGITTVVVGIGANGRISTCRPLKTSGYVELDNHTCGQLFRFARYNLSQDSENAEGLKYQILPIRWSIPK